MAQLMGWNVTIAAWGARHATQGKNKIRFEPFARACEVLSRPCRRFAYDVPDQNAKQDHDE